MKKFLEKLSLLSLSLMMITPFSVAPALPRMLTYYQKLGYNSGQVNILFSLSSFAILAVLLVNPVIARLLKERVIVSLGLLLIAFGGTLPIVTQVYSLVFLSRVLLGIGIGLINAKAINIISERFSGKEKVTMLGYRGAAEVLGSAVFTMLAGILLAFGWTKAFAIYGFALVILALYLLFVPMTNQKDTQEVIASKKEKMTSNQLLTILGLALYAGFVIIINTSNTLRIPVLMDQLNIGTASQASLILSLMMLMGILAGIAFGKMLEWFKSYLMAAMMIALGLGMGILWRGDTVLLIGLSALLTGFVYSIAVTSVFHTISEIIPSHQLTEATTLVLLGCNIGGGGAAIVLQMLTGMTRSPYGPYGIYAALSLIIGLALLFFQLSQKKKPQQ